MITTLMNTNYGALIHFVSILPEAKVTQSHDG
jgi:hypothetical protein